jgi:DNA-binding response OmpR family regulator
MVKENGQRQPVILVVDDNPELLQIVRHTLAKEGFAVDTVLSGEAALAKCTENGLPDLALVDINMPPGMDGFAFCDQIFQFSDVPVIMLTAVDEVKTVVRAIQQYAEDYIVKPFNPAELVARVQRVLERVGHFPYRLNSPVSVDGFLTVDFPARTVGVGDSVESLTPTETRLLYILMRNSGETVTTEFLLRRMWPNELTFDDRLHVYVHRLRRKLEREAHDHTYIVSERGVGYRFQQRASSDR